MGILIQEVWGGAPDSEYPKSTLVILLLQLLEPTLDRNDLGVFVTK